MYYCSPLALLVVSSLTTQWSNKPFFLIYIYISVPKLCSYNIRLNLTLSHTFPCQFHQIEILEIIRDDFTHIINRKQNSWQTSLLLFSKPNVRHTLRQAVPVASIKSSAHSIDNFSKWKNGGVHCTLYTRCQETIDNFL